MKLTKLLLAGVAITALTGAMATADAKTRKHHRIDTSQDEQTRQLNMDQLQKAQAYHGAAPSQAQGAQPNAGEYGGKQPATEGMSKGTPPADDTTQPAPSDEQMPGQNTPPAEGTEKSAPPPVDQDKSTPPNKDEPPTSSTP